MNERLKTVLKAAPFFAIAALPAYGLYQESVGRRPDISYTDFVNQAERGEFDTVSVAEDYIFGESEPAEGETEEVSALIPQGASPYQDLKDTGVDIEQEYQMSRFWMFAYGASFLALFSLAVIRTVPSWRKKLKESFAKLDKSKRFIKGKDVTANPKVTFDDVQGIDEVKAELEEVLEYLKDPEEFHKKGLKPPRGILLVGSPGGGKTLLARALSNEADVPFHYLSGASLEDKWIGTGSNKIQELFEKAREKRPCIIFIDELDAFAAKRKESLSEHGHRYENQTIDQLLTEMDGFEDSEGIVMIAATNLPDILEPALLRPGRLTMRIDVPLPDIKGREKILELYAKDIKLATDLDLEDVAKMCPGMSGAELKEIVNSAALIAHRDKRDTATLDDFRNARDRLIMGIERKSRYIPSATKKLVAQHELGHAFVGYDLENLEVDKISIIPRRDAYGATVSLPPEEATLPNRKFLKGKLAQIFGGRAAEKIFCDDDEYTAGAHDDIKQATEIARRMVMEYGMADDKEIGSARYADTRYISEAMMGKIDQAIVKLLADAEEDAKKIIQKYIDSGAFEKATELLLDKETISGDMLAVVIKENPPTPTAA